MSDIQEAAVEPTAEKKLPLYGAMKPSDDNKWWLSSDLEGTLYLMPITEEERDLNAGRFTRFRPEPYEHVVPISNPLGLTIDWINDETGGGWSLRQTPESKENTFEVSFERSVDAVHMFLLNSDGQLPDSDSPAMFGWMNFIVEIDDETKKVVSVVAELAENSTSPAPIPAVATPDATT